MKKEVTVDYNIKSAWHSISRMYNSYGVNFDVTASTGFVLLNIDAEKGTPATKIAPMMGLESRSLTRMLKSMEEKGWIYRQKDPEDGRSVRIFLSDEGNMNTAFTYIYRAIHCMYYAKKSGHFYIIDFVLKNIKT